MKRNKYSLSNYKLTTAKMGELIPVNCLEVLPGDTFQQATSALIRVSPLLAPVMHPVQVRIHHWFVPLTLIWDDVEDFFTGGEDGNQRPVHPYYTYPGSGVDPTDYPLLNHLGLNTPAVAAFNHSALPVRAYQLIWNEFYRDQDLQTKAVISKASGLDTTTDPNLKNICWEKDYFTSSRPWTQKGDDITIDLGDTAPVVSDDNAIALRGIGSSEDRYIGESASTFVPVLGSAWSPGQYAKFGGVTGLEADLSSATAVTINQLREAFALQRYAEARSKYGSRYTEYLRYLGVKSSDARMHRPEYLGGGKQTIQFSEVLQTGGDSAGAITGVGNLAGHGIAALRSNRFRRFFEEHGFIISLMSVRPKTIYTKAASKMWFRATREDYHQKELENIGQAPITMKEVTLDATTPDEVFGYQDRYDEYRRAESMVTRDFKSELNHWHLARDFAPGDITLNEDFVKCDPTTRIHAVEDHDTLWIMANNSIQARRIVGGG